jgi:predicted ATPase
VFEVTVSLDGEADATYRLEVEHEKELRQARIVLESLTIGQKPLFEFRRGEIALFRDDHSLAFRYAADGLDSALARVPPGANNRRLTRHLDFLRSMTICSLNPKRFGAESLYDVPLFYPSGANFASWYRHQIQERPDWNNELLDVLRSVVEGLQSMRLEKVGSEARALILDFEGTSRSYPLRLDELSDGQRALIALYALVHFASGEGVLIIDEPDNFLALAEIQPWLMALSDTCGTRPRQAILCSHHPELIDYLGGASGVLLKRESSGSVTTRRLSEVAADTSLKLSEVIARGWEQ